jgi:Flp pilus assembly pilin Flp
MVALQTIRTFLADEDGQDLTEYALLVALIAMACIAAVARAGTALSGAWGRIADSLEAVL